MYDSSGGALHECENCGATLPPPDEHGTRTCTFCHTVYTAPTPAPAPAPAPMLVINAPGYTGATSSTQFEPINPPPKTSGCGCALLVIALIAAAIGGGIWWGVSSGNLDITNLVKPTYNFQGQVAVLPGGEPSSTPAFVTIASHYDGALQYQVIKYNGKDAKAVWTSTTVGDLSTTSPLVLDDTNAYVAAKAKLYAFKLTDGSLSWQSALSDEISTSDCADCLTSVGGKVIARSNDGNLQAFNATNGSPAWSRTLESTNAHVVRVRDHVIVADGKGGEDTLSTLDLATGQDAAVLPASCTPRPGSGTYKPSWTDEVLSTPSGDGVLVLYESSPACIQSFDPATGALQWGVSADRTSFDGSSINVVDTAQGLVIGDNSAIGVIGPDHAAYRDLGKDDSLDYLPIGASGNQVIVEEVSNRGTAKTSIVGIDLTTGAPAWQVSFGKAKAIDKPHDSWSAFSSNMNKDGTFTAHVDGTKVWIVTATEDDTHVNHVSVDSIDIATGKPGDHKQFDAETGDLIPTFGPPRWFGSKVLARIGDDTMQIIDASTGTRVLKMT